MKKFFVNIKKFLGVQRKKILTFIDKKPFASFFIILGVLFILIVISNILGAPKKEEKKETPEVKQVRVYQVGSVPKMTVQAQIEKSGVIHLTALAPGVIWSINKTVGQHVEKGETLFNLSSNYQGGNTSSLQRQMAQTQYKNVIDTYDLQKDMIQKQRDLANKSDENSDQLRDIMDKSLSGMKSLIDLNNDILSSLDKNLSELESTNVGGANDALILSTKQLKSQFLAANNQAVQASLNAQYASAGDKPPAELSNMQKDLALKQLDFQVKMLDLNREISRIQLQIAQVVEAMMYPASPFSGTIQRIFVKVGEQVGPGTPLAILSQDIENDPIVAIAYVPYDIAKKISRLEPSIIHFGKTTMTSNPSYITQDAIQGSLYGVYFDIPDQYATDLTEKGSIHIDLPLGYFDTGSAIPFVPIDSVYQTKDQSYVYVVKDGEVQAKSLKLGLVFGSYVEVEKGLEESDRIIIDRNVIAGDRVSIQQ